MRHVEDVAHPVVLFLIDLVGLEPGEGDAVVVDRHPHLDEDVGVVVVDDLRPDDAGVRAVRLLDHEPGRVGIEDDVVVAEQQEDRAFDRRQRVVGRGREPAFGRAPAHERPRQGPADPVGRVLGGPVVEHEDGQGGVVLGPEGGQALLEPGAGLAGDHDRDHGRDDLDRFVFSVALEQIGADRVGVDRLHEAGRG